MAINEADILRQLGAKGIGKGTDEIYRDLISELADSITETFREYTRKNTRGSGTLGQSFKAEPNKNGFTISADFYYDFINEGVKGAPLPAGIKSVPRTFNGNSRFSFKTLKVGKDMEKSIAEWTGRPIGQNYGVAINIKKRGIHPKNITDNVIDQEMLDKIGKDLTDLTGLAVEATFDKAKDKLK